MNTHCAYREPMFTSQQPHWAVPKGLYLQLYRMWHLFWSLKPSAHICRHAHIYMIKIKQITVLGELYLTDTRWKLVVAKSACKHHIYEQKEILAGGDACLCLCVWFCPLFPSQWWALDVVWLRMPHIGSHISLGPSLVAVFGEVIRPLGMEMMCSN